MFKKQTNSKYEGFTQQFFTVGDKKQAHEFLLSKTFASQKYKAKKTSIKSKFDNKPITDRIKKLMKLKFYKKVQPGGWWGPITTNFKHTLQPVSEGILVQWLAGVMMIYGFTFGIGNLIFMQYGNSVLLLGCAFIGAFIIWNRSISHLK